MNILVIGGTQFIGRHFVDLALANGHQITLFHRGQRGAHLFEGQVERILGDRDGELEKLSGRHWDAVLDTCGYVPRITRLSSEFLRDAVDRYLFISTISVYDPAEGEQSLHEGSRLATMQDPTIEEITGETYGALKVLCEQVVDEIYSDRATIVRPTFVVGPYDPTDRFTYWPLRLSRGGKMLAGGRKDQPLQFIDARDLGALCLTLLEKNTPGTFNAAGPGESLTFESFLQRAKAAIGSDAELVWADAVRLQEAGGEAGKDFPLYQGPTQEGDPYMRTDASRAIAQGLTYTPIDLTVRDTLEWASSRGDTPLKVGMTPEREQELLAKLAI